MAGRPTKMTPDTLRLLKDAFLSDATNEEACIYADICETAFYEYKKKHPEYTEEINRLKGMTGLKAKVNIRQAIDREEDPDKGVSKSMWWLERRDKDFQPSSKVENIINPHEDFLKLLQEKE